MYLQVCVSKAKSASLSPSYIWEAELIPLALFIACQILEIVEANTFQETSYHIAWNDFWPRLHFCHFKCWPISLTLSQLVTVPGLKMTSSEKFDLDLAQEYQISWTGDLDMSSQTYPQNQMSALHWISWIQPKKQNANVPLISCIGVLYKYKKSDWRS